ncbi:MAG: Ig-like domain-containing protein [Gemmatimonadaceae bacterium]|nr:Ig-like domain-containing protein [Gemmatimonadaceae bacterium]
MLPVDRRSTNSPRYAPFLRAVLSLAAILSCGGDMSAPDPVATLSIAPDSGTVAVGTTLALSAHAEDAAGRVLTGRAVTYLTSDAAKATVTGAGIVRGIGVGAVTIIATSENIQAQASFTVIVGAPSNVVVVSGAGQSGAAGTAAASPLVVKVTDAGGNGIGGVTVAWATTAGALVGTSTTTDANGLTQRTLTFGHAAGAVTVTASAAGISQPATFALTAVPGAPAAITKVSGDAQTGMVSAALAKPFVISVADQYGNVISGASVTWSVAGAGALTTSSSATNATGQTQTALTFGSRAGTTDVTATVGGASQKATFSAIAASHTRDDWITYAHDERRTGATQASVRGPLTVAWHYIPVAPTASRPFRAAHTVLPTVDAIFLQWSAVPTLGPGYVGSTDVDRVSPAGQRVWTFDGGYDANLGNWGSLWGTHFVFQDDGLGYLNASTGAREWFSGVDWWGETLTDGTSLWVTQDLHIDGPGPFIAKMTATGVRSWVQNSYGHARGDAYDSDAGMAVANGVLFYAGAYHAIATLANPPLPGVYAFDATTGARLAFVATSPTGKVSADDTRIYLIENGTTLVARAQSDLHVVWSATVVQPTTQPPVLANRAVIIATRTGVVAYDVATGTQLWSSAPISGLMTQFNAVPAATATLVAALGSGTLVASSSIDGIHILSLATGVELSKLALSPTAAVRNPVVANDPTRGAVIYGVDSQGLVALMGAPFVSSTP